MENREVKTEQEITQRRRERREEMRRQKELQAKRRAMLKKYQIFIIIGCAAVALIVAAGIYMIVHGTKNHDQSETENTESTVTVEQENIAQEELVSADEGTQEAEELPVSEPEDVYVPPVHESPYFEGYVPEASDDTAYIGSETMISEYAVLINLDTGKIIASKEPDTVISPASMTKILTLLTAVDAMEKERDDFLDEKVVINMNDTNFAYSNGLSAVNFSLDEEVTVRDLLYGTILPSGGDAAHALAVYVAGSHEAFVDMMNEKVRELGLDKTAHFTNCAGMYHEDNHCTVTDMAMILKAAIENPICKDALSAHIYTTSHTEQHPDGIEISNWFLRRIEDKDTHGQVICAKTGFVNQSRNCAASYAVSNDGTNYICVTGSSSSSWRAIYDHVEIYTTYTN